MRVYNFEVSLPYSRATLTVDSPKDYKKNKYLRINNYIANTINKTNN